MNLVTFHRILIGAAILFLIGYGTWEMTAYSRDGDTSRMLVGLGSFAAAALLLFYLKRLRRFLRLRD